MKPAPLFCLTLAIAATTLSARADDQPSAAGYWVTAEGGSVVEIAPCDSGLCGRIVGLRRDRAPGESPKDEKNSDPAKREVPLCGLMIMGSLRQSAENPTRWEDGWAYDPTGGKTYSGQIELEGADVLKLRGYVGIPLLGRTETWTRENPETPNRCGARPD